MTAVDMNKIEHAARASRTIIPQESTLDLYG